MANVNGTHRINNEFIRVPVERDMASKAGLKGLRHIKKAQVGTVISEKALLEATRTKNGFNGFNYGAQADVFVAKINQRPVLVTTAEDKYSGVQRFVMQSPKSGAVIGRGNVSHKTGQIEWTRTHNNATASQKAEVNDAGK